MWSRFFFWLFCSSCFFSFLFFYFRFNSTSVLRSLSLLFSLETCTDAFWCFQYFKSIFLLLCVFTNVFNNPTDVHIRCTHSTLYCVFNMPSTSFGRRLNTVRSLFRTKYFVVDLCKFNLNFFIDNTMHWIPLNGITSSLVDNRMNYKCTAYNVLDQFDLRSLFNESFMAIPEPKKQIAW